MMKKISATLLIILLLPNLAHSAPKLSKDVEKEVSNIGHLNDSQSHGESH